MDIIRKQLNSILSDPAHHVEYRIHAVKRIFDRGISRPCVTNILINGDIIEGYPDDCPFPSCLILGKCEGRPIHIVTGLDIPEKTIYIITVYEPFPDAWDNEFRRRK